MNRIGAWLVLAAILAGLAVFASRMRMPDTFFYTRASEQFVVPGCAEIHCFRVLVPWTIGVLPGSLLVKWKGYAVVANAAAAIAVFDLSLVLGLTQRAAVIAALLTVFGFGSLYTLFEPYTSDPLMFFLGPLVARFALENRMVAAAVAGCIGVFAKEFVLVPIAIVALVDARMAEWRRVVRGVAAAAAGFVVWLGVNAFLRQQFGYSYGPNSSPRLLKGSYLVVWLHFLTVRGALSAMFNEFGAAYLLIPFGWIRATPRLKQIVIASLPFVLFFCYVQQPDRALWNFHFVAHPLAALVLEPMSNGFVAAFLALYTLANLKVGAQFDFVPKARYAFALDLILAALAVAALLRSARRSTVAVAS